jgi:hypothetical protein
MSPLFGRLQVGFYPQRSQAIPTPCDIHSFLQVTAYAGIGQEHLRLESAKDLPQRTELGRPYELGS